MARCWRVAKAHLSLFKPIMKKLFFLLSCLLVLGSIPTLAQGEPDMAIVQIDFNTRKVVITRAEGKSEVTDFSLRQGFEKRVVDSNELYYATIKRLQQEGYTLKEVLNSGGSSSVFLFVKTPKP